MALGNPGRNLGYGPRGKARITLVPQKDLYEPGETITISVEPEPGHAFHNWRGSMEGTATTMEFTVTAPAFIQAVVTPPASAKP